MDGIRRVWVTRAEPGAGRTASRLVRAGFQPVVRPLLEIRALAAAAPATRFRSLAFTSPNGVAHFARLTTRRDTQVFAVGDATAAAAREAGWLDVRSASGAIDDLARLLREECAGPVLAPGAREPAGDLSRMLSGVVVVSRLAVYEAIPVSAAPPAGWQAVLVHSPRAGRELAKSLEGAGAGGRLCVAISPAAAAPLGSLGFGSIRVAARPDEGSVFEALGNPGGDV